MKQIWQQLGLERASLAQIELSLRDGAGEERQPAPRKLVSKGAPQTLSVWRGQDPAQRIANTILLCAIRDQARQVIVEPKPGEVRVQFLMPHGVREQKLPSFSLQPIVHHFQSLAQAGETGTDETSPDDGEPFSVDLTVDDHRYHVQFSALPTQWGKGVTMQFSLND